jgi:O-antigen ligase
MSNYAIKNLEICTAILLGVLPIGLIIGTGVSESVIIIINILFLVIFISQKNYLLLKKNQIFYLTIIWLYLIINYITANNPELSFSRSFFFFRYILLILAISHIFKNNKYQKIIFTIWSFVIIIVTFDIFYEFFFKKNVLGYTSPDHTRIVSFMRNELRIGGLVLGFFLFVVNFWNSHLIEKQSTFLIKITVYFTEILIFIGIFLTGERANSLKALLCCLFILFFFKFKKKFFLIFLILLVPVILFFSSDNINLRYKTTYMNLLDNNKFIYNTEHGAHYNAALSIFANYPLLGVGNKNFRIECEKDIYLNPKFTKTAGRCSTHPHQIYFEILAELGLIGFFLIFGYIFINIYKAIKIYFINKDLILLSSISYLFSTLVPLIPSGSFFSSFNATIIWVNIGIMISFIINNKRVNKNN